MTALAVLSLLLAAADPPVPAQRLGRLDHPAILEASGIVASRRHPGIFWVHNDSGNASRLFAVRRDGSLVREFTVAAPNVDWEDIATDDHGHLYIGEIGNNNGRLPLRAVYQVDEPDPFQKEPADEPVALPVKTASFYRFAPGGRFDAEGLAIDGDTALIVAKTFDGRDAEVYALPMNPPSPLMRPALPRRVGTLSGFTEPVTGASLSRDGRLAVCSTGAVGIYKKRADGSWNRLNLLKHEIDADIEAVAWDGDDLILTGERRGVYRIAAATLREHREAGSERSTPAKPGARP
jgi:hypothetical protein